MLTVAQIFIGAIHVFFGFLLLAFENLSFIQATIVYDVYTIIFGVLTVVFAVFIWQGKKAGWIGTIAISAIRDCCRFFDASGFAKHTRDTKVCRVWRNNLQLVDYRLLMHQPS